MSVPVFTFNLRGSFCPAGVCSVLDGSSYMTFDGKSYTFNENCSYYLVKEIINKYNLTIIVNNNDKVLTVIYQSTKVVFSQLKTDSGTTNVVSSNSKTLGYEL